jgi:hypothetical protein
MYNHFKKPKQKKFLTGQKIKLSHLLSSSISYCMAKKSEILSFLVVASVPGNQHCPLTCQALTSFRT